ANLVSKGSSSTWQAVEWADDNQHLLLQHLIDNKSEFIMLDRTNPAQSVNINQTLNASPGKLTLINKKFDQYYLYDGTNLTQATLTSPSPVSLTSDHVLAYQSYAGDTVLYITDTGAPSGKVLVKLKVGSSTYEIRRLPISPNYLVNLTTYSGTLYVAAGASTDNRVYIYADPVGQLSAQPNQSPIPIWTLHLPTPNFLGFSANTQFIMAENG